MCEFDEELEDLEEASKEVAKEIKKNKMWRNYCINNFGSLFAMCQDELVWVESDGKIHSENGHLNSWKDIKALASYKGDSTETDFIIGLKRDGSLLVEGNESSIQSLRKWTDITELSIDNCLVAGLKKDGTVVVVDRCVNNNRKWLNNIKSWNEIVSVKCVDRSESYIAGVKKSGKVVLIFNDEYKKPRACCGVQKWENIKKIYPDGNDAIIGLKNDGTVVHNHDIALIGKDESTDIVSVATTIDISSRRLLLRKNGTIAGAYALALIDDMYFDDWTDILNITCLCYKKAYNDWYCYLGINKKGEVLYKIYKGKIFSTKRALVRKGKLPEKFFKTNEEIIKQFDKYRESEITSRSGGNDAE